MRDMTVRDERPRTLRAAGSGWLVSHGETAVYAYALVAFWTYSAFTRVLVRAMWFKASPMVEATSPLAFAFVHLVFAPALLMAHAAAYKVGLPASHRLAAAAKHALIALFVLIMAKFAYLLVNFFLLLEAGEPEIAHSLGEFWAAPGAALGASIELASLYCIGQLLAAGVVNWRRYHLEAIARTQLVLDAERSRSMALRRQLDPHSLYNTLNAISGSVRSAPATAIQMLGSLGELLRLTLRDDASASTLAEEFRIAAKYLALYQLRYPDKLSISVELPENCRNAIVPPLLLQPLVENAALHGVNAGCPSVVVRLKAAESAPGRIEVTISNTTTPSAVLIAPAQSTGIGLRNTWERLRLSYGEDFSLTWAGSTDSMARLRLEIPRSAPASASLAPAGARSDLGIRTAERSRPPVALAAHPE